MQVIVSKAPARRHKKPDGLAKTTRSVNCWDLLSAPQPARLETATKYQSPHICHNPSDHLLSCVLFISSQQADSSTKKRVINHVLAQGLGSRFTQRRGIVERLRYAWLRGHKWFLPLRSNLFRRFLPLEIAALPMIARNEVFLGFLCVVYVFVRHAGCI